MQSMSLSMRERMHEMVQKAQKTICQALEELDGGTFQTDTWQRAEGGGGTSCVLQNSRLFEKAGVNVSQVFGVLPEGATQAMVGSGGEQSLNPSLGRDFFATGVSLVLHPHNPMVPTVHANYRYFERGEGDQTQAWWFGGGADLTPAYLFDDDAQHFHQTHKAVCDRHDPAFYPNFKAFCDRYFWIAHRNETRGIGGIFFDNLCDREPAKLFDFVADCAAAFLPAYLPIVKRRQDLPYTEAQRVWQQLRRGRYAEFNLVYDRGTVFGLKTGGRIESILMSLPLTARWQYNFQPSPDTPEFVMQEVLKNPRNWLTNI